MDSLNSKVYVSIVIFTIAFFSQFTIYPERPNVSLASLTASRNLVTPVCPSKMAASNMFYVWVVVESCWSPHELIADVLVSFIKGHFKAKPLHLKLKLRSEPWAANWKGFWNIHGVIYTLIAFRRDGKFIRLLECLLEMCYFLFPVLWG